MKKLSKRRAREFKGRWAKRMFGMDRKARAERWAMIVREFPDSPEVKSARTARILRKGRQIVKYGPPVDFSAARQAWNNATARLEQDHTA